MVADLDRVVFWWSFATAVGLLFLGILSGGQTQ